VLSLLAEFCHLSRRAYIPRELLLLTLVILTIVIACASRMFAAPQNTGAPPIRVESGEVIVPVMVFDTRTQSYVPGLTARNFRVFDDRAQQRIGHVSTERVYLRDFRDNVGSEEREWAWTPGQMWSLLNGGPFPIHVAGPAFYLLSYAEPSSGAGSCHNVRVKVSRKNTIVRARTEYCGTTHAASDPLNGTTFSKDMEKEVASSRHGQIPLSIQAGFFYTDAKTPRIYVVADYPTSDIQYSAGPNLLAARLGILTEVYGKDGVLAARASDLDEEYFMSQWDENRVLGRPQAFAPEQPGDVATVTRAYSLEEALRRAFMPNHHETQMALDPGKYDVRVLLDAGGEFGRAEIPLTVDAYDGSQLGISSIMLCKQYDDPRQNLAEAAVSGGLSVNGHPTSTLFRFTHLISRGNTFTPAGDTTFKKNKPLFAYYEVYEPLLGSATTTQVRVRLKIVDNKTGALESDTGFRNADEWVQPGSPVIAIAQRAKITALATGSYRLEVRAEDSAGQSTAWRAAAFRVE
jgi:hypothetical protein